MTRSRQGFRIFPDSRRRKHVDPWDLVIHFSDRQDNLSVHLSGVLLPLRDSRVYTFVGRIGSPIYIGVVTGDCSRRPDDGSTWVRSMSQDLLLLLLLFVNNTEFGVSNVIKLYIVIYWVCLLTEETDSLSSIISNLLLWEWGFPILD